MNILESHIVPEGAGGRRFSDYACEIIRTIPSRKGIKNAIKRGDIRIDGNESGTGAWIQPGQRIELVESDTIISRIYRFPLDVVHEDDHLAVINKPAGIAVNGNRFKSVENALPGNLKPSAAAGALRRPRPVHRLDASTGGLLLIAKTSRALVALGHQFEKREITKRYRAIVMGRTPERGSIDRLLEGREALTEYCTLSRVPSLRNEWLSLLDLVPHTGRTHQLRIHMADEGFPILGDALYGTAGNVLRSKGLFLWSVEVSFTHPASGLPVVVKIDEPVKFDAVLERERRRWEKYRDA
ncbi:MAG: RluA family pseudouridine synthase [Spirochaetes bacterium]|nr:MAG: RluA family pseudouridine synthase [Spirochaetota bacterium]